MKTAWYGILGLIVGVSPLRAQGRSEVTLKDSLVSPESVTSSQDGTVYFGSMTKGAIYRAKPGAAQAEAWIPASNDGLTNVLGVLADDKSNTLWVCANQPFRRGGPPAGGATLKAFDLATGAAKGAYLFPSGGLCNDIAVASDGATYTSDTFGGRVLRLTRGSQALEVWAADSLLAGIDGLSFLADGSLYANNYFNGSFVRISAKPDGSAGSIAQIKTSLPFRQPDGLRTVGPKALLQAEGQGRLTEITIAGDSAVVRVLRDGLTNATAVTVVGNSALVLVEHVKAVAVTW